MCVGFFEKRNNSDKFNIPDSEDKWPVPVSDIVSKLPKPLSSGGAERVKQVLLFAFYFSNIRSGTDFSAFSCP